MSKIINMAHMEEIGQLYGIENIKQAKALYLDNEKIYFQLGKL